MFKKIPWTFSIYFLNVNHSVSVQYQCLFLYGLVLWIQSMALSRLCHKLTLESPTSPPYKLNRCSEVATQDRTVEQVKCNVNML